jgi:predicted metal-dependent phosphoesterase TrpH
MSTAQIPGSKWWKFDFHAHSPASDDYPDKSVTAEQWVQTFMAAEIDAVVVSDHNSGEWVDALKAAVQRLKVQNAPGYRDLTVFPGVELAVSGGTHILLVLPPDKGTSDVAGLIRTCGYTGAWGVSAGRATMSLEQVLDVARQQNAIVIPAHVDDVNGLWQTHDFGSQTNALSHRDLFAVERKSMTSAPPSAVTALGKSFAEVVGSDAHQVGEVGRAYTWVKMGLPSLEGLRLALLDGNLSLRRYDDPAVTGNPNLVQATHVIERIEVHKAKFLGHVQPFVVEFNPWMNTLIGGRGTGKSSLLEFMRITLRRENELDGFPDLKEEFDKKYSAVWAGRDAGGLQTQETKFQLIYRKDGQCYRINFCRDGSLPPIEEPDGAGGWRAAAGDIPTRFPIRIYSQKQIYELADTPTALLQVIDQDGAVAKTDWDQQWSGEVSKHRDLMTKIREAKVALTNESRLRGELDDVNRKLQVLESSGNQAILQAFQRTQDQSRQLDEWGSAVNGLPASIRQCATQCVLPDLDVTNFDPVHDADVVAEAKQMAESVRLLAADFEALAQKAADISKKWSDFLGGSEWAKRVAAAATAYQNLVGQLKAQGVNDPNEFDTCVRQKQTLEQSLKELDAKKEALKKLEGQRTESLQRLLALRQALTDKRVAFLSDVLKDNNHVRISVVQFGDHESAVREYRRIIRREEGLDEDVLDFSMGKGMLKPLYEGRGTPASDFLAKLQQVKDETRKLATDASATCDRVGAWFMKHLTNKVKEEDLSELDWWYPEDSLQVEYRPREGDAFRPISQGSPGQKTAALLAFLLSYGTEPILLDQPEDDLDNQLIFGLVTQQLVANKLRRQVIIVTHNANIVVNGDAELVLALEARRGQTAYQAQGGLQDGKVRQTICDIMEGGEKAFELRYRRIKEGLTHA